MANGEIKASCLEDNGSFFFNGCTEATGVHLILSRAVLHMDANYGVTHENNFVSSWVSRFNKDGNKYTFTPTTTVGATLNESDANMGNKPTISLNGSVYLDNTDFNGISGVSEFTRIVVGKKASGSSQAPVITDMGRGI